jgi:Mn2+/Fe2+ NRAMP family transporter
MGSVLVASAATLHANGRALSGIGDLDAALAAVVGGSAARIVLAAGILGAALVASIVVSLALAWAVAEGCGRPRSLADTPRGAPLFYGIYAAAVAAGAGLVLVNGSLVRLAVHVEILNALLLPLVLGFLVALAFRVLPRPYAPARRGRLALAGVVAAVVAVGLVSAAASLGF